MTEGRGHQWIVDPAGNRWKVLGFNPVLAHLKSESGTELNVGRSIKRLHFVTAWVVARKDGAMTEELRRQLNDHELTQLQETGCTQTLGGFTLASLIASLDSLGIGPEDVEITGDGESYGIELFVVSHEANASA